MVVSVMSRAAARKWWALAGLSLGVLAVGLDATVLSVALPTLAVSLHASATDLQWEGVEFGTFYRTIIESRLQSGASVTHVVFGGLDGYRSVVAIEDALAEDVLIAERLNGRPLDSDHGAPARLVSPNQYGYVNTKHLCAIELHTAEPTETYGQAPLIVQLFLTSSTRAGCLWRRRSSAC